jgi:hypothetical protein
MSFDEVKCLVIENGFTYPFCVKPDVGLKGLLFRKVDDEEKLKIYHQKVSMEYLIQELIDAPLEVSVFYYRYPANDKGTISGFIQKDMLHVFGDGKSSLWELIAQHPNAKYRLEEMRIKHEKLLETVVPSGEKYILTHAANLNRGAKFTNLKEQIDDQLLLHFDYLSHRCSWYYGRYDLKCNSVKELKEGRFSILEFNGAGAEPNHVYHAGKSWLEALLVFAHHWKILYQIGKYNNKNKGVPYWTNNRGRAWMKQARQHGRLLAKLDCGILI